MKETGIIFTPDNIRAIMEGRKTQTRRVMKVQPTLYGFGEGGFKYAIVAPQTNKGYMAVGCDVIKAGDTGYVKMPYRNPGDRLYVKEGVIIHGSVPQLVGYYMDGCRVTESWEKRRTAMFMPKWAARTWLEITDVRVERLQDISEDDCLAEGIWRPCNMLHFEGGGLTKYGTKPVTPKEAYELLWDSINKKKHPWSQNPWVWTLTFRRIK